jgi:uncharacterized cupin superfamily protein
MCAVAAAAPLESSDGGLVPRGEGWFVLNALQARWLDGHFGAYTRFEGDARFAQLGINIAVLAPGQPDCHYHAEDNQEDFLVLAGECLLLVEGQERRLRAWDLVHCAAGTEHVLVGAGEGPCAILAVGARRSDDVVYPDSELARRHHAGVERETRDEAQAYAGLPEDVGVGYQPGWLPGDGSGAAGCAHNVGGRRGP